MDSSAVSARLIGAIFVEKGLLTEEQLELALEQQRASGDRLGEILVEQFGIERLDLASALAEQWAEYERQGSAEERGAHSETRDLAAVSDEWRGSDSPTPTPTPSIKRPIGEIFIERGLVTDDQLEEALQQQKETGTRLGEILVASGKLSRLELASALADQWASFQKLRPPAEASPAVETSAEASPPLPTPEVVTQAPSSTPAPTSAPSLELAGRLDALAARVDQLATDKSDWKPQLEKVAELLRARLEHLEAAVTHRSEGGSEDPLNEGAARVWAEIAALAARIDGIPRQNDEWRVELSQLAENLRTRFERVETGLESASPAEQIAELRAALDEVSARVESLPVPSEEWRRAVDELTARMDSLPVSSEEWRQAFGELAARVDSFPVPSDEWRGAVASLQQRVAELGQTGGDAAELRVSLEALVARVDSLPVQSEEWRDAVVSLDRRVAELGQTGGDGDHLRASVEALAARVDSLPMPSDEWRQAVGELAGRIDSLPVPSEEWRDAVASLQRRVTELGQAAGEAAELRASMEALVARVDSLPVPSEEWRQAVGVLAARVDSLPVPSEEWRDAVASLDRRVAELGQMGSGRDELGASLEALAARVDSLPVQSDEWRQAFGELAARVDSLPLPSEEWRDAVASLQRRVAELGQTGGDAAELRASLEALAARVDSLPVPSDEWRDHVRALATRIDALPTDAWRSELGEVAESLRARVERVEQGLRGAPGSDELAQLRMVIDGLVEQVNSLPVPSEEWREPLADLAARIDSLPVPSEEWRDLITHLAARVDALTTGDVRSELAQAADGLRKRIERIEEGMSGQARAAAVTQIGEQVDELARKVADTEAVEARLHALTARVEAVPIASENWGEQIDALAARFDSLPVPSEELRGQIEALAARVDAVRTDEWKTELAQVAENLRTRVERVEQEIGGLHAEQLDEVRSELAALAARIDATPEPLDGIRTELADLAQTLHGRVGQIEHRLSATVPGEALDGLSARIAEIASRVDDTSTVESTVESRLHESLSALVVERVEELKAENGDVRRRLDEARQRFDAVAGVVGRVDEIEARIEAEAASAVRFTTQLDEQREGAERQTHRVEKLSQRVEELASRRNADEVEQTLAQRIDSAEASLADLRVGLDAVPPSVEERIAASEARIASASRQGAADVGSLRRELDGLRAVVNAAEESMTARMDVMSSSLNDELAVVAERSVGADVLDELRSTIEGHDARIEGVRGEIVAFERTVDEKTAGRSAELSALRARLETVEAASSEAGSWSEAVDATHTRIETLELHVQEFAASEAVERDLEIEGLRGQLSERVDALESAQVKRKDVRELSNAVERIERRVDERLAQDEVAVRATEEAVREGIASLSERLSASGDAYLETGRDLSRSMAGLGLALSAADAHGVGAPRSTDRPAEISVFLAFAPTAEGYRLVECTGTAPALDDEVNIEECEGPLVVTRVGASPLPFDARPCVYLERS